MKILCNVVFVVFVVVVVFVFVVIIFIGSYVVLGEVIDLLGYGLIQGNNCLSFGLDFYYDWFIDFYYGIIDCGLGGGLVDYVLCVNIFWFDINFVMNSIDNFIL